MFQSNRCAAAICLIAVLTHSAAAGERQLQFDELVAEFNSARDIYTEERQSHPSDSPVEKIQDYETFPLWSYLPQFTALTNAQPNDQVALKASQWVVESCRSCGNSDARIFAAEKNAWEILGEHHSDDDTIALLCLEATQYESPAREVFLRKMAGRKDLRDDAEAYALLALAEYLHKRSERREVWDEPTGEFNKHIRKSDAPEWGDYFFNADSEAARAESIELCRQVIAKYADKPFMLTAGGFRDLRTFGDKARKSLHALEHLYVGAPAPEFEACDLNGRPIRLTDYRGKVVVLSFWFPGCGPCIAMAPKEQNLVEKYRDQPFALIGVCRDDDVTAAKKVADEHGMAWPSVDDGQPGQVTDAYNVLSWPTFHVVDAEGKISALDASWEKVEETVATIIADMGQEPQIAK